MKVINKVLSSDFEELELYVLGDLHIEDKLCDKKQFNKWLKEVMEKENRYVILNGDLIDNATKSSVGDTYEATLTPHEALNLLTELLTPIKDRILVISEGNHENRTYKNDGIRLMELVADKLGIKDCYAPSASCLFVSFGKNKGRGTRQTVYSIYSKHGSGGGKAIGGKANALLAMSETIDADIYIHNHTHVPISTKNNFFRSDYRNRQITEVKHTFLNGNSFLKFGGYGEAMGFRPSSVDYPKIILSGYEKDVKVML